MKSQNGRHPGEKILEENLREALEARNREARKERWWNLFSRVFSTRQLREQEAAVKKLKEDLVNERLENKRLLEAAQRLRRENEAYRVQVESLIKTVDLDNFDTAFEKAQSYDRLRSALSWLREWAGSLVRVTERFEIRKIFRSMHEDLRDARDGFQKIKIYRKYLAQFEEFPSLGQWLEPFRKNREKVKDRAWLAELVREIRDVADLEK
ncbi:MAG: hypothetical protein JNM63_15675, partial [Spirochaetia bacterium]|nr:hypothetical protein [Spirochaetia bacterium]